MQSEERSSQTTREHLTRHLKGKVVIIGIGHDLAQDDAVGSLIARRIKGRVPFIVYDAGPSPENYLGKVIKDAPDTIVFVDAVDFAGAPGTSSLLEGSEIKTAHFFTTHNASLSMAIGYLQSALKADIMVLAIQPKSVDFGDTMSAEVERTLEEIVGWFDEYQKEG